MTNNGSTNGYSADTEDSEAVRGCVVAYLGPVGFLMHP
jgi:hypothetical protein